MRVVYTKDCGKNVVAIVIIACFIEPLESNDIRTRVFNLLN